MIYSYWKDNFCGGTFFAWWDSDAIWSRLIVELTIKWLIFIKSVFYSLFRLTSLIYAEKFELGNSAIMEDK